MDNIKEREYLLYRFNHALKEEKRYRVTSELLEEMENKRLEYQKQKKSKNDY